MPIGEIGDLSPRALSILSQADLIACEDTRRLAPILAAYAIRTPTISYFEHNEERRAHELVDRMRAGASVTLVTDAGTPGISDPGFRLVRLALDAGIRVGAVPGPSAVVAALSIAGLPTDRFIFEGFLPSKSAARRGDLKSLARETRTIVLFEAARRLGETLTDMAEIFGSEREAAVVREISKTYEEVARGSLGELAARFNRNPARGEITLVVAGAVRDASVGEGALAGEAGSLSALTVEMLREAGLSLKQASVVIARLGGGSRREIYQAAVMARRARQDKVQDDK